MSQPILLNVRFYSSGSQVSEAVLAQDVRLLREPELRVPHLGNCYAIWFNGRMYIDTNTLNTLSGAAKYIQCDYRLGRRQFFDINNPDVKESVEHHIAYKTEGVRNMSVKMRNQKIWALLQNFNTPQGD